MLTRLKVDGFKNLMGVDIQFGPFTCIAGANGVGKSNLFDAIHFLSDLASKPLLEAALSVRDEEGRSADVRDLFHRVGTDYDNKMTFEAQMIVPRTGIDDLGQTAKANMTFLRYGLTIGYREYGGTAATGGLEILREELHHINLGDATKHLNFSNSPLWRRSVIAGRRTAPYLSTLIKDEAILIELHQDGGPGRTRTLSASTLPRTVLSTANAAETPTMLVARREMQSWRLLQLEPSALRRPDEFMDQPTLGSDGSHLPATLYHLSGAGQEPEKADQVYSQVANRLHDLLRDVRSISVDRDDQRRLLTLQVTGRDGTPHPARALSDGTLRFLALSIIAVDPTQSGVICLEEPENGIHPERIRAMLSLLQDIATDIRAPAGLDNPMRQVIINTHSPVVVGEVNDEDLVIAELREEVRSGQRFQRVEFKGLPDTWRTRSGAMKAASKARLLAYLNPIIPQESLPERNELMEKNGNGTRVIDRQDLRQLILPFASPQ